MVFSFSDEQNEFRASIRRFFDDKSSPIEVRRLMETENGYDELVWRSACNDLGLSSLAIPEAYGGAGFGYVELCIALEEMGRSLFCAPFYSSVVLASNALLYGAEENVKREFLPRIASGELRASLAVAEGDDGWNLASIATNATPRGDEFVLNGEKPFVIDGCSANVFIVAARNNRANDSIALFLVDAKAEGLKQRAFEVLDPTRKLAKLSFSDTPCRLISAAGAATAAIEQTFNCAAIALANEMVGGAERLLESAVEYAKLRMQFGRVIGSFQAIKHKCADMLLDVEHAKSAAYYAAMALDENDEEVPALASLAKAQAADCYLRTATQCIQIHGGIGFTWDNDTHLWFKRAKSSEVLFGSPSWHRERYVSEMERVA